MQASGKQRAINARRKLLDAGIQGVAAGGCRSGLDDARTGIGFHHFDQIGQAPATHHAVGVEHQHVAIICTPTPAEIVDIAALALDATTATPIENAPESINSTT
ncbi:hypothetical protein ASE07_07845 [Noviherbaspirillum sp. Root189]|nr:hypothetical protein ASE07_07845 [Noviherbaspirillum sp. Root189]